MQRLDCAVFVTSRAGRSPNIPFTGHTDTHVPHPTLPAPHFRFLPSLLPPSSNFGKPGFAAAGYVALTGDLPGALASFKANYPILVYPTKFIISFPLVYHYLGGMRHFAWDLYKIGNQADKTSLLETPRVEESSKILLGASAALSLVMTIL